MYDTPRAIQSGAKFNPTVALGAPKPADSASGDAPRSEIANCLAVQEKATLALSEVLDLLESKLMPVAWPTPPGIPDPLTPTTASVPVAGCIVENTARIQRAIARIEDLRSRIAL